MSEIENLQDELMTDTELRGKALDLAMSSRGYGATVSRLNMDEVLSNAWKIYGFLRGFNNPRVEHHDENTLRVVRDTLVDVTNCTETEAAEIIDALQNRGILFRERISNG